MLSINYETKRIGTKDGQISFGHIHSDQVKSSLMFQGQEALEYITIDQTEPRKGWITSRCRGRYQIKCGDLIPKDNIGFWLNADSSDIVIQTKGRIRMEAENIDIIANGPNPANGNVNIKSNEAVNIETKKLTANATESLSLFTDGVMQQVAINIMKSYAGDYEKLCARSAIKPPIIPISQSILQYATNSLIPS